MRRVLFSVSVMAAFGGMCTGALGLDEVGADLDAGGTEAAVEAEPAEPPLAIPVEAEGAGDEADETCCCAVPDGEPRREAAASCAERGGTCGEAEACETTDGEEAPSAPATATPAKPRPAGKTLTREEPRTVTRPGERKVQKPGGGSTKQVERK